MWIFVVCLLLFLRTERNESSVIWKRINAVQDCWRIQINTVAKRDVPFSSACVSLRLVSPCFISSTSESCNTGLTLGVPPHSFPNLFLLLFLETKSSSVCLHWFCEAIYLCQPGEFYGKINCLYDYKVQLYMNMWVLSMMYVGETTDSFFFFFFFFFAMYEPSQPLLAPPPVFFFFGPLLNKDCQVNEIF